GRRVEIAEPGLCAVVRRAEFDATLLAAAEAAGVEVHENEKVRRIGRADDGIRLATEHTEYATTLVIGADGSGSLVRPSLFPPDETWRAARRPSGERAAPNVAPLRARSARHRGAPPRGAGGARRRGRSASIRADPLPRP